MMHRSSDDDVRYKMYECLRGKKLLVLGATPGEISLVKKAQEYGVKVYVTDSHTDYSYSPAKYYADTAWDISWSDIDTLERMCREEGIDGVAAGYSEIRVESQIRLCERLGLPCYCTMEQLEVTRDKIKFKEMCRKNGVPTVKEYASPEEVDQFPVIVKPVDRAGSIGVGIASNQEELEKAYAYAMEMSLSKEVIIEEYIYKAIKMDSYYEVINGEIELITTDDVINAHGNGREKVVQSGWVMPSIHADAYLAKADENIRKMIRNMGIQNGYLFFSGFADKNSDFVFFECGFRLCGGHTYNYFEKLGFHNTLDLFILHALTGSCEAAVRNEGDPDLKCATLNFYSKAGTIASVHGFDEILKHKDCGFSLQQARIGQVCTEDKAILSKVGVVYFCNDSVDQLCEDISLLNTVITAEDTAGNDLIYDRVDPEYVRQWWNKELLSSL